MNLNELEFESLTSTHLKPYSKRAPVVSAQFLRWFLEHIFRQDAVDADDACVDNKQDKGIDGLLVDDVLEVIYVFQSKVHHKTKGTLGDVDLKTFSGTLEQFSDSDAVQLVLDGNANQELKNAIRREDIVDKLLGGYIVEGVFCCNVPLSKDGHEFVEQCPDLTVYDAERICAEFVDLGASQRIIEKFDFNIEDSDVIQYQTPEGVKARIFLADALQLTHMSGIEDGSLFTPNVRLSLGNTKVNKSLMSSVRNKREHKYFPLYHNGVTVVCGQIDDSKDGLLSVEDYNVVNGAQSLTSLLNTRNHISSDLKILVKVVALGDDQDLSARITQNSNNQNATRPRDHRSNHAIQQRLQREVSKVDAGQYAYEVKRGEVNKGKIVISNEEAGLALLALDLGEPWACHQKGKVMDESHSRIFGRADVNGSKVVALHSAIACCTPALEEIDDTTFAHYALTRYFLSSVVASILKTDPIGQSMFENLGDVVDAGELDPLLSIFSTLATTTAMDLNAEVIELTESGELFDYKKDLKSPNWSRTMIGRLTTAYQKDVKRSKATSVADLLAPIFNHSI